MDRRTHIAAAALVAGQIFATSACAVNPVTGERQLALISEAQEIQMGRQASEEVEQGIGLVPDQALQQYVHAIGTRLASSSERPELPWTFRVVDDPTPNAFALPGGYIFFTRGLMNLMDSEAELAAVLGHEIGHVTARHAVTQISRAQVAQLGLGIGSIFIPEVQTLGNVLGTGMQLLFLHYGRDAERQSDELGFRYAVSQGYDVREMDDVFIALQRLGEQAGQSPLPSWLASHPDPGERIEAARERAAALSAEPGQLRIAQAEYLARIDGLVYGQNPRQGFFRDGVFYHPDLRFRFSHPQGWRTQNTAQAVMGMSPEQDAALQLSFARPQGSEQAARAFLNQEGVRALQSSRESINGVPAVVSAFQAQTGDGAVQGWVAFLDHDGRTYQLLAYAPTGVAERYDRLFRQVITSFGPVSDPAILGVQPDRLEVVRLDSTMSLAEFNARHPSAVSIDELVVINQVPDANTPLPAGTPVKRVVPGQGG
jgi:predicted Zn-dependent protease